MKHFLLLAMIMLAALCASAQEMRVLSMRMESMDLTAATHQRLDLNGVPCAVVKVQMPEGAAFEGSIIKPVEYRTGEYWVYMPANSKALRVKHGSAKPLQVSFADHGVPPLQSKTTYVLDVAMPAAQAATQQKVEIRFSPADAIVLIDGQIVNTSGGIATDMLAADRDYSYTVTSRGYIAQQGTFHLHPAVPTRLNIELSPDPSTRPQAAPAQPVPQRSESEIKAEANKEYDNRNYARAMELYKQISNDTGVQNRIGYMYRHGQGVGQSDSEAANWYRKSAEQGFSAAQCNLGYLYQYGKGVSMNYTEAVNWYRKAAEQGYASAQCNLGYMYETGKGVGQNLSEAVNWYRKAAEQGDATGQCNLGYMYEVGKGVGQNYSEAANWYRKSANQGFARAQNNLGLAYYYGRGVSLNKQEAYQWLKKAADQNYEYAIKFINEHSF